MLNTWGIKGKRGQVIARGCPRSWIAEKTSAGTSQRKKAPVIPSSPFQILSMLG